MIKIKREKMEKKMLESIIKYLDREKHKPLYFTSSGCEMINRAQEMITRERVVIKDEKNIIIPGCQLYLINDDAINGFTTRIDDKYCIFINKGVLEAQKIYLESLNWEFCTKEKRENYISDMIEYGFFFFVFHEYAHIYCGHVDASLTDFADKKAQECEADMFAVDYLVNYILNFKSIEHIVDEMEKMYLAVFFLFQKMQKENYQEIYNDRLMENYYAEEKIEKRNHPLDAQRMLYLYDMLNVVIITDKVQLLPVKESIIERLKILKGLTDKELPKREFDYLIANESVQKLKQAVVDIRKKIPRIGENSSIDNKK